jgi:hypothetical protein
MKQLYADRTKDEGDDKPLTRGRLARRILADVAFATVVVISLIWLFPRLQIDQSEWDGWGDMIIGLWILGHLAIVGALLTIATFAWRIIR